MKAIYPILLATGLIVVGVGIILINSGCDEIQAPCDTKKTETGMPGFQLKYLESWRKEDGFGILRFIYPDRTIFFVCTDRTLSYKGTLEKRFESDVFTVIPQARLIWKYAAPKPGKAVLTGLGSFHPLFEFGKRTSLYEDPISLAYSENAMGGAFIPGMEIKIKTLGNQSDDCNYVWDHFLQIFEYEVTYRLMY
jgi:hypothetical protein